MKHYYWKLNHNSKLLQNKRKQLSSYYYTEVLIKSLKKTKIKCKIFKENKFNYIPNDLMKDRCKIVGR